MGGWSERVMGQKGFFDVERRLVLQSLHNLSDDRTEYLIRDRISFMRFLDGAGCHHDLAVSRGVGAGRADRQAVCALRPQNRQNQLLFEVPFNHYLMRGKSR